MDKKPKILLSKCLEIATCRYNAQRIPNIFVKQLMPFVDFVAVCPEEEIGLGTPRDPIRIVKINDDFELFQPTTGIMMRKKMDQFSEQFLTDLNEIDGCILKSRSPSCGPRDVKIYKGSENIPIQGKRAGFFAASVQERFGFLAVEDEGRLHNFKIREHFLTRVFLNHKFRDVCSKKSMGALVQFQAENKLLFMGYNQKELKILGKIVANFEGHPIDKVLAQYREHFYLLMGKMPRTPSIINVLMHAFGYFSKELNSDEKSHFLDILNKFREGRIPLSVPNSILRTWIARFQQEYLAQQNFFDPYPESLVEITDSGKGRNLR